MNKKKRERLKRKRAEWEAEGRGESKVRQEKIKVLWDLDETQLKAAKNPTERKIKEQELKAQKLKQLLDGVRESAKDDGLVDSISDLVELAGLQDREIEYLKEDQREMEQMREHCPSELQALLSKSAAAELEKLVKTGAIKLPTPTSKQKSEWKRSMVSGVGLIEWEFGGGAQAEWRKYWLPGFGGPPYSPACLDEIFRGGAVTMRRLQELFGMRRNRFPRNLPCFKDPRDRRERLYGYDAVCLIMDSLLSERPFARQKRCRGGSQRRLWLRNPDDPYLMTRVLERIEARICSLSEVPEQIAQAFRVVVRKHLLLIRKNQ
jgi:hypothetical protein